MRKNVQYVQEMSFLKWKVAQKEAQAPPILSFDFYEALCVDTKDIHDKKIHPS